MIKLLVNTIGATLIFFWACEAPVSNPSTKNPTFPEISQTAKPWTRWWWHGSQVTPAGITAELEALQEAGIGGIELTPIYGIQDQDAQFIDYLSDEWVDLLLHTLKEAERLGLGVDMATGTGWPFGGPWVTDETASKYLQHRIYQLEEGQQLSEIISFKQSPVLRTVQPSGLTIGNLKHPITDNKNLQHLAIDQVRYEQPLPLLVLMAYSDSGEQLNLTEKVDAEGKLIWTAPKGSWDLYALFQGWHGKMVERAAPGGEGLVIDHFSTNPIHEYLAKFDTALKGREIGYLRAFFNDSYEVDDARGQANWTPNLFQEFAQRRGYDLRTVLPALLEQDSTEKGQRVLSDYRETISDLLLETFTQKWSNWAQEKGAIIRNQAHGSPANILDLYAASDIPETEGTDIIKAKMASSAAHLSGKKLASAEAATWLGEHFTTNLADLKENVDRYLAAGINHVFYHGTCYSPPEAAWPGRLFYAAIHANPRNPLWHDYPALNQYIGRTQAFLQSGVPDNDLLLYFPAYDRFATPGQELLDHFHGEAAPRGGTSQVRETAEWLQEKGYGFDFVSDRQLGQLKFEDDKIVGQNTAYKAILVPNTTFIPLATLEKLYQLANQGATIIFQQYPKKVAGWYDWKARQAAFQQLLADFPKEKTVVEANLSNALTTAQLKREILVDQGMEFHRRKTENGPLYFLTNWSENSIDGWVPLTTASKNIVIFDPMTGKKGLATTKVENGQTSVYLQLNRGASLLLQVYEQAIDISKWSYIYPQEEEIVLDGPWRLEFIKGGPTLPVAQTLQKIQPWTNLQEESFHYFSGTAVYSTDFVLPGSITGPLLLDLGLVSESATVKVNGQIMGTVLGPDFQLILPASVLRNENTLAVEVSNSMANRIMYLEKNGVRWQQFYNINISARQRENLGSDRVFTTKGWSTPMPSGIVGPVVLKPLNSN